MRVEKSNPTFKEVRVVLESEDEVEMLKLVCGYNFTVSEAVERTYGKKHSDLNAFLGDIYHAL